MAVAQEVLRQTSCVCWKLQDVCYSDWNWSEVVDSFPFIGFADYRTWLWITGQVYCNRHELLTLTKRQSSPPFHWRSLLFMSICVLSVFVGCCSVPCFQCVSFGIGCRSLIAPSVFFSHFGLMKNLKYQINVQILAAYMSRTARIGGSQQSRNSTT